MSHCVSGLPEDYELRLEHFSEAQSIHLYGPAGLGDTTSLPSQDEPVRTWHCTISGQSYCDCCHHLQQKGGWFKGHGLTADEAIGKAWKVMESYERSSEK